MTANHPARGILLTGLALVAAIAPGARLAADDADEALTLLTLPRADRLAQLESGAIDVELDLEAYGRLFAAGRGTLERFPLPGGTEIEIDLRPFSVIAPDAVFVSVGPRGERFRPRPRIRFVRGHVDGSPDSLVVLTLFQNRIAGFVRLDDAEYGVGPRDVDPGSPDSMKLRVWDRALETGGAYCDAGPVPGFVHGRSGLVDLELGDENESGQRSHLAGAQLAIQLAIESTTEWCAQFGNDAAAAEAWLLSLAAQMSAIYDAEVSELIQVPFLRTFCGAADPYTDGLTQLSDLGTLLDELETEWSTNMGAVARTVTHIYTRSDDANGFSGGLANTYFCSGPTCASVLCDTARGYGVTMFPANSGTPASFELGVAAHELGHNHSSPHTNCLQDSGSQWLSTCRVESCNGNPWCDTTGCFPGPQDTNLTGTIMSTGCNARDLLFDDEAVEAILRNASESASCVDAAGLPGDVRESTGDGLRLSKVATCPGESLINDDGSREQLWGACSGCQFAWIKRFTPSCYPFQITRVDAAIENVSTGRPVRVLVYSDPAGTGDPANATLVYSEDVTVDVVGGAVFNQYTLAAPVTVNAGDVYLGIYDLQVDSPAPFMAPLDVSTNGDSYRAINSTSPGSYALRPEGEWMIRGVGGPVPAESVILTWGLACNDATVPGQDFAVYRGDIPNFSQKTSLTCSTGETGSYFATSPPSGTFFLVVPHTTPSEGSYGRDSTGAQRQPSATACKPQSLEICPGD